jgi:hypothetical protein
MPKQRRRIARTPKNSFGSPAKGATAERYPEGTTPEERTIIDHSRASDREERGQKVLRHPDGSRSSVLSGSVEHPRLNAGKPTLVPHLWEGKIVESDDEAAERAVKSGKRYPAYESHEAATEASKRISSGLVRQSPTRKPQK